MTDKDLVKLHCEMRNMLNEAEHKIDSYFTEKVNTLSSREDDSENAICEQSISLEERLSSIEARLDALEGK